MKLNRKRSSSGTKNTKSSKKRSNNNNKFVDCEPDNAPFVDDINDLFNMGFVSIEEVDYFDPKKHLEQEEEEEDSSDDESENVKPLDSALKAGWTVSTVKNDEKDEDDIMEPVTIESTPAGSTAVKQAKKAKKSVEVLPPVVAPEITGNEMKEWKKYNLNHALLQGLKHAGFESPMAIQAAALDALILQNKRDILGSAPTGSGKTLAFGLPLLNQVLRDKKASVASAADVTSASGDDADNAPTTNVKTNTTGLIIVPTRELAVQIEKHLKNVSKFAKIRVATVVGGLSQEKQSRQLKSHPDVIIATPGRLNELMEFDQEVRALIVRVKFLILDEADRMIQVGHFKELDDILARILKHPNESRQILLFSATLVQSREKDSPFARLCRRLNLDKSAKNLAQLNFAGKPTSLLESFSACASQEDKEAVLLGFLKELKTENGCFGRVLLFANSIDTIRRIAHLMALLEVPNISLHAQMQQRQRLNNLDRFKAASECLMIASDVAARGIDIVGVDHVIHFHLPKSKETYVHRCGRTARANLSGTSLALVAPEERKLAESCGLTSTRPDVIQYTANPRDTRDFILPILKLARRIEKIEHSARSARSEINWAQKLADECELVLDEDNDPSYKKRQEQAEQNPKALAREIEISKSKLKNLLDNFYPKKRD